MTTIRAGSLFRIATRPEQAIDDDTPLFGDRESAQVEADNRNRENSYRSPLWHVQSLTDAIDEIVRDLTADAMTEG